MHNITVLCKFISGQSGCGPLKSDLHSCVASSALSFSSVSLSVAEKEALKVRLKDLQMLLLMVR